MTLSVAVIAGGKSRRFGSPKALAEFRGMRLIDHAMSLAHQLSDDVFVCCGQTPLPLDASVQQLPDLVPDCGPISGLHSALKACKTEWLAIMPCDMPLLTADIYKILLDYCKKEQPIVAVSQTGIQPLVSLWSVHSIETVRTSLVAENYGLQRLLKQLDAVEVSFNNKIWYEQFQNVNTLNDLTRIQNPNPLHELS